MKPSFLNCEKPLITTMIQKKQISDVMYTIEKTLEVGTDAFGVQLCKLLPKFQNAECTVRVSCNYKYYCVDWLYTMAWHS